jgi:hypothetical protein
MCPASESKEFNDLMNWLSFLMVQQKLHNIRNIYACSIWVHLQKISLKGIYGKTRRWLMKMRIFQNENNKVAIIQSLMRKEERRCTPQLACNICRALQCIQPPQAGCWHQLHQYPLFVPPLMLCLLHHMQTFKNTLNHTLAQLPQFLFE